MHFGRRRLQKYNKINEVDDIIENDNADYKGLAACSRDTKKLLEVDSIIICDIMNVQKIKEKLERLCYYGNVTDLYEIINAKKP